MDYSVSRDLLENFVTSAHQRNVRCGSFATQVLKADARTCPLLLQKPTNAGAAELSAKVPIADIGGLIDYLVGPAEQRGRYGETEHPGSLRVDD